MYYLQIQEKLNFIAENAASGSIKDELMVITKQYTSDKLKQVVNITLETYQIFYNMYKGMSGPYGHIANLMKEGQNGNHVAQVEQKQYSPVIFTLSC